MGPPRDGTSRGAASPGMKRWALRSAPSWDGKIIQKSARRFFESSAVCGRRNSGRLRLPVCSVVDDLKSGVLFAALADAGMASPGPLRGGGAPINGLCFVF